jgi:hypothetical protein
MLTEAVTEVTSFISSMVDGKTMEWLKARVPAIAAVESSATLTYAQMIAIAKAVCAVMVPLCGFINGQMPAVTVQGEKFPGLPDVPLGQPDGTMVQGITPCAPCGDQTDDARTTPTA